jgi:hypothetical protein
MGRREIFDQRREEWEDGKGNEGGDAPLLNELSANDRSQGSSGKDSANSTHVDEQVGRCGRERERRDAEREILARGVSKRRSRLVDLR